jgi:hypothetical protein
MMNNGWTPERRKRQSEMIMQWKPWTKSTGFKSQEGKAVSKMNAYKHGLYGSKIKSLHALLMERKRFFKNLLD